MYRTLKFKSIYYIFFLCCAFVFSSSCKKSLVKNIEPALTEQKAKDLILNSIAFHGGHKAFRNLITLDFNKDFTLYKSDGSVEFSRSQTHNYFPKQSFYKIGWKQDGKQYLNTQKRDQYLQHIDGHINPKSTSSQIKSAIDASVFTILIPYKLLNEGAQLSYEGEQTLKDGTEVLVVKATYDPTQNKNHTKTDIWWHYFNKESYRHEGYLVQLIDHTSLIRNLDFQRIDGFIFPAKRKSWRINDMGEKEFLRAEYAYQIVKAN